MLGLHVDMFALESSHARNSCFSHWTTPALTASCLSQLIIPASRNVSLFLKHSLLDYCHEIFCFFYHMSGLTRTQEVSLVVSLTGLNYQDKHYFGCERFLCQSFPKVKGTKVCSFKCILPYFENFCEQVQSRSVKCSFLQAPLLQTAFVSISDVPQSSQNGRPSNRFCVQWWRPWR